MYSSFPLVPKLASTLDLVFKIIVLIFPFLDICYYPRC